MLGNQINHHVEVVGDDFRSSQQEGLKLTNNSSICIYEIRLPCGLVVVKQGLDDICVLF